MNVIIKASPEEWGKTIGNERKSSVILPNRICMERRKHPFCSACFVYNRAFTVDVHQITEIFQCCFLQLPSSSVLLAEFLLVQWLWSALNQRSVKLLLRDPVRPPACFRKALELRNGFYILFKWLGKKFNRGIIFSNMSKLYKIQISVLTTTFFIGT